MQINYASRKKERKDVLQFAAQIFSKYGFLNFAYVIGLGVILLGETNLLLKIEAWGSPGLVVTRG